MYIVNITKQKIMCFVWCVCSVLKMPRCACLVPLCQCPHPKVATLVFRLLGNLALCLCQRVFLATPFINVVLGTSVQCLIQDNISTSPSPTGRRAVVAARSPHWAILLLNTIAITNNSTFLKIKLHYSISYCNKTKSDNLI